MRWMDGARMRLRQLLGRRAAEERMDEEIGFHIDMETEKNLRGGMDPAEARRRAVLAFGGVEKHREEMRSSRKLPLLEDLARDARHAARSLRGSVSFTAIAVLTLALGIGASTAMFSVLQAVLFSDLPVQDQDEVVVVWLAAPARESDHLPFAHRELVAFRERTHTFESVAGVVYQGAHEQVLLDRGEPVTLSGTWVTGELFPLLRVAPVLGRALQPSDDVPGASPVMVIGYGFWQRYFGGDPSAIGHAFDWNGKRFRVVGVLPRGFEYPSGAEFWVPVLPDFPATLQADASPSQVAVFNLVGRLLPGVGLEAAREDLDSFIRTGDAQRPAAMRGLTPVVSRLPEIVIGDVRGRLWAAAAAVALLLLIACVNIANLLLICGSARTQELAIRSALGAGRSRLVRQLLTESGMLALLGGVLGTALAVAAVRVLVAVAPPELPRREMIEIDGRVLLFAVGISAAAALLSGLLPALLAATGALGSWLRDGSRTASAGRGAQALRHGLVIGQVAVAILVVAGAGLVMRSLVVLQGLDMGFNEERLLIARTTLPAGAVPERPGQVALQEEMLARVSAIPSVTSAASLPMSPFSEQGGWTAMYSGEGQTAQAQATNPWVNFEVVGPEYFRTLEIPLYRGRAFGEQDHEDAEPVAIISGTVARHTWPGEDPIGERVKLGPLDGPAAWHTVVGVVGETRYRELTRPQPSLYLPIRQFGGPVPMSLAVRTGTDPAAVVPQIRLALQEVHPDLRVVSAASMRQQLERPLARPRFSTMLLGLFALITLTLAAIGIYGVMAATVRQRTREIGLRLALGAREEGVRSLVLRQGMRLALWGCVLGTAAALLATRTLEGMLFEISPNDPLTFVVVAGIILGSAALACYPPARRAARVDPVIALRAE